MGRMSLLFNRSIMFLVLALPIGCELPPRLLLEESEGIRTNPLIPNASQIAQRAKERVAPPPIHATTHDDQSSLPMFDLDPNKPAAVVVPSLTPASQPPTQSQLIPLSPLTFQSSSSSVGSGGSIQESSSGSRSERLSQNNAETPQPNHILTIASVVLTESGLSIEGKDSPTAIVPNYTGKTISITINGDFRTAPKTTLDNMLFLFDDPKLKHQSLVGKEPPVRVTLDDFILFTPVSASATQIVATLDTTGLPDLYLKGLHKLTVHGGQLLTERLVRVADPEPVVTGQPPLSLSPSISKVEVLRDPETNKFVNVRLTGRNLMLSYRMSYIQVDSKPVFGHQTNVLEAEGGLIWEQIVHLPSDFVDGGTHTINLVTPFGSSFFTFSSQGN